MTNTLYKHYKKKGKYTIIGLCKYKHQGEWYDSILYKDVESGEQYVRQVESFEESFNLIVE